ncbi:hypothetical protein [uncultured Citricoccus sp.]|uniref:hypothetical protein n=1 Tax=uncultured Citricoccus sp. TaxID=614031 RepID=UPI002603F116|nr:hypothetical protein [uncultured Citricoccus sp.]
MADANSNSGMTAWTPPLSDVRRDRWSRPYVTPPGGGAPKPYQRVTTFVSTLEDRAQLEKWAKRMVGVGLAARQADLLFGLTPHVPVLVQPHGATVNTDGEQACACGSPLNKYGDCQAERDAKRGADELIQQALDAAAVKAKANIGTAWHAITQKLDEGGDPGQLPPGYDKALQAYADITRGWQWLHIEQLMVCDEFAVAGTPDRIAIIPGLGPTIVDLKSGASTLKFGMATVAMQLACYSRSLLYNHETGARSGVDGLNQDIGVVVALSPFSLDVELRTVDLQAGWEACRHAAFVRDWRKRKDLAGPFSPATADGPPPVAPAKPLRAPTREAITQAIRHCRTREALLALWQASAEKGAWDDTHTEQAKHQLAHLGETIRKEAS